MTYSAESVMAGLKPFQQRTVEHVIRRFYDDDDATTRFLVADETGLGKSIVARGVIARSVERLQHDNSVDRIDIVYVCSNADIARQNVRRLDVFDVHSEASASRLTMLARHSSSLTEAPPHPDVGKPINLVAFTPGTSLSLGRSTGTAEERALLHLILCDGLGLTSGHAPRVARLVLQAGASQYGFESAVGQLRHEVSLDDLDSGIVSRFLAQTKGQQQRFVEAVERLGRRRSVTVAEKAQFAPLIGELREELAHAAVETLEPDLIILDEFQRFRHLLDVDNAEHGSEAELARALFNYDAARVLLLSATPYKPFTYAEERAGGDDHHEDLKRTLLFLAEGDEQVVDSIGSDLQLHRRALIDGVADDAVRHRLEGQLTKLMCRTERPLADTHDMLAEIVSTIDNVEADDIAGFVALQQLARAIDAPLPVDYWKSVPHFINFCQDYKFGGALRDALADPERHTELAPLIDAVPKLSPATVRSCQPVDAGNARLRYLLDETVEKGWWKLLWVPPACPYTEPGGPFADSELRQMSKWLVFSSWTATPTAIAGLASHAAASHYLAGKSSKTDSRLDYRLTDGQARSMTTLATFWPNPTLADSVDPTTPIKPPASLVSGSESWVWGELFTRPGAVPDIDSATLASSISGSEASTGDESKANLSRTAAAHVERAIAIAEGREVVEQRTARDAAVGSVVDEVARFGPGNIAWRCLGRLLQSDHTVTEAGRWVAAARLAGAVRRLFNRPDSAHILDHVAPADVYWRSVLLYCRWGNLEAVMDEWLFGLSDCEAKPVRTDAELRRLVDDAAEAITLRESRYQAFDPDGEDLRLPVRFAVRYGGRKTGGRSGDEVRSSEVKAAFNSPFWPFILATTSIGQEGIDLHWWCRTAVHWNTPASPVDFEQREGRVHRFGGIAVRRNLADAYASEMKTAVTTSANPWAEAFEHGRAADAGASGGMSPHWVTPGTSRIERRVLPYILSKDVERLERLKRDLTNYRLTFGQARQEDLLELAEMLDSAADVRQLDLGPPPVA